MHISPTLEGFRASFRRPSLALAEIAWRWTVGAMAAALFLFAFIEFLDTLPVTHGNAALLETKQPLLVGRAIAHILRGSLSRAVLATLFAALALSVLWIIVASIGRAATVRALLDYFRRNVAPNAASDLPDQPEAFPSLIGLHFLRVAAALAAFLAFAGAAILASFASPDTNPRPGLAVIIFLPLAGLICIVWSALNWLLSLAGIFAVSDGEDSLGSLSAAVTFFRERAGPVSAVSTWTALAHVVAFSVAASAVSVPLAFAHVAPSRLVIASVILVMLVYFGVADWLYMARLAGYVCIAEMPDVLASSVPDVGPPPARQQFAHSAPAQTTIDHDEPILSDVPGASLSHLLNRLVLYTGHLI